MDRIGAKPNAVYRDAVSKGADVTQRQVKHLSDKKRATDPYDDLVSLVRAYDDVLPYVCLKSLNVTNPCLLVASKETIELLKSKHGATIFIDGTHAMTEHGCQLVTFTIVIDGHGIGAAYAITRSKTHDSYAEVFRQLKLIASNEFSVKHVVLDSEEALHSAVRATWPMADIHLCFFHFLQAIKHWFNQHRGYDQVSCCLLLLAAAAAASVFICC